MLYYRIILMKLEKKMNTKINSIPDISVIIPTFNVEAYIGQCIESLLNQTFTDFEIICVDDGSTDRTAEIIKEYAQKDSRLFLLEMPHCGLAGNMRNEGIERARGEYLLFLDGDDFFESEMLEHSLRKAREDDADICLFDARLYNETSKKYKKIDYIIQKEYIPSAIPFEGKSSPYIFNITTGCPWSKLIRKKLIDDNQIRFMALPRSNDVYFIFMAMVLAPRITILEEVFVNYRQSATSLQANNSKTPLDWYKALKTLKEKLEEMDLYKDVELSFRNLAFGVSIYNLCSLKSGHSFCQVYERMKSEIFEEFDLTDFAKEECYSYNDKKYEIYQQMMKYDVQEYLFNELQEMKSWKARAQKAERELGKLKASTTLKAGKALLFVPKKMKGLIGKK